MRINLLYLNHSTFETYDAVRIVSTSLHAFGQADTITGIKALHTYEILSSFIQRAYSYRFKYGGV